MGETSDKATGKVKQAVGDLTGNDKLKREGKRDHAAGEVKGKVDDAVDKVKEKLHRD